VPTGINRNMRAALKQWWSAIDAQVRRAAQDELPENHLLSKLLQLRQAGSASAMTRSELNDELATWLLTGTETTANTLAWTCYLLARDAQQQAQLYEQVQSALQGQLPGRADLKRLPQLEAVLWEAMRLYPQAYLIGRKAVESFVIDGYHFPEKTTLILNQWSIGRDPRWFREPTRFDPGRWRDGLPGDLPKFAFFPFGGGGRICLGRSLAQLEMPLVLAMLLQRFRFELGAQPSVRPCPSLTLRPEFGRGAIRVMRR
jgi:cytochrome P450